ncbi:UDP-glucuronosyltransferase 1A1-like [Mustelus asterias]
MVLAPGGLLLLLCVSLWGGGQGGDLLVVPVDGSHWLNLKAMMEELGRRGHRVVVVVPEVSMKMGPSPHYTTKVFPVPYSRKELDEVKPIIFANSSLLERVGITYRKVRHLQQFLVTTCESLLYNTELMRELAGRKFDALLTDPFVPCGAIVGAYLSLPTVNLLRGIPCGLEYSATQCPRPLSFVPRFFSGNTDRMTFPQRVKNVLAHLLEPLLCWFIYSPLEELASKFLQREVTLTELLNRSAIWLFRYDFVFEHPRPLMPNMVLVGGINCKEGKPLPQDLEEFVSSSGEHGTVILSLGSMISEMPPEISNRIADALGQIPQKVLWRYTGTPPTTLAPNTKLLEWLPQNDLLEHPKTRAFITHGGTNGIYEAVCSGVPSVMLPLFGDQNYNVDQMLVRGAGIGLEIEHMSAQDLVNALNTVINDTRYKENMMKLSALHRDHAVHPMELAVHWVEFVMRHGGAEHLRTAAHDLNWFQYHSLDVAGALLACVLASLWLMVKCCCFCCKCCVRRGRSRTKRKPE